MDGTHGYMQQMQPLCTGIMLLNVTECTAAAPENVGVLFFSCASTAFGS